MVDIGDNILVLAIVLMFVGCHVSDDWIDHQKEMAECHANQE